MRPAVTVVGLGPAGSDLLGDDARQLIAGAGASAFLRTRRHPAADALGGVASFDHHYEAAATFDEVYDRIVADLFAASEQAAASGAGPVVYAVPGSPLVAERTVELLRADPRVDVTVVPALSFLDLAWARLGIDPLAAGVRLVDGTRFAEQAAGERGPLLVAQCWSTEVLSSIKLSLEEVDPHDEPSVTVLSHLGLADEVVTTVPWHELDRVLEPDHLTSIWVPRLGAPVASELMALGELVRRLRAECPWDRQQTHASLTRHLLEESYEVLDAIDALSAVEAGSRAGADEPGTGRAVEREAAAVSHLEEELGDLLFQVYFHSCLAAEEGRFTLADVARGVHDKLVSRHPHVFGDVVARDAGTVLANWEEIKKVEKGRESVIDGIPMALPALALAAKLQRKAAGVPGMVRQAGADDRSDLLAAVDALWAAGGAEGPEPDGDSAGTAGDGTGTVGGAEAVQAGELLWAVADLVRRAGVEPEDALRAAALAFSDRVREAERGAGRGARRGATSSRER